MSVFLSYSTEDRELAEQVRDGLTRCGFEVWSDQRIRPGDNVFESIGSAIKEAEAVVMILGRGSTQSSWTSVEVAIAVAADKRVIPVLAQVEAEVPMIVQGLQRLDFTDQATRSEGIRRLCDVLAEPVEERIPAVGLDFLKGVSSELEREQQAYESDAVVRNVAVIRTQVVAALLGVLATVAGGLIIALTTRLGAITGAITGVLVVLISVLAYYLGSVRR